MCEHNDGGTKKWSADMVSIANKNEMFSVHITFIRNRLMRKNKPTHTLTHSPRVFRLGTGGVIVGKKAIGT